MSEVLRRAPPGGMGAQIGNWTLKHFDGFAGVLRSVWPIPRGFGFAAVLRFEDVVEVFANDSAFPVDYADKLSVIMGGHPFLLGMGNTQDYRRDIGMMRRVVRAEDIPRLCVDTLKQAEQLVTASQGQIEVVEMVRAITFDVLCRYLGVSTPPGESIQVWATRLFEFQFADPGDDPSLRTEVDRIAPLLRAHVDTLINHRKTSGADGDDVLGRLLALQAARVDGTDDAGIRTALVGFVVGGPPQPPMVVPQALEQLLQFPSALAGAQVAARADDDAKLAGYLQEALRFDPLAPGVFRRAAIDTTIAAGTPRSARVRAGTRVFVAFRSAMKDSRFVPNPRLFDPKRPADQYIHFGHGLHTCFGIHINRALLPLMLKPLLTRPNLRRAAGAEGHLTKRGAFSDRLVVEFD